MSERSTATLSQCIRAAVLGGGSAAQSDADLLAEFVRSRDAAAFEALVRRHGPLVRSVCRQILTDAADADDACQATFVVLFRKATSIRKGDALAGWLFRVARRAALEVKKAAARRRACEIGATKKEAVADPDLSWREACAMLHEELDRLPASYRLPLILCYLEGKARDEAAQILGWTLNEVRGRLERGRLQLRQRLEKRGVTLSAGLFVSVTATDAFPSDSLRAIVQRAADPSPAVKVVADRVSVSFIVGCLKLTLGAGLLAVCMAVGVSLTPAEGRTDPPAQTPPANADPPAVKKDVPPKEEQISFAGRVVGPDGKGIEGAKIYLTGYLNDSRGTPKAHPVRATSGKDGQYSFTAANDASFKSLRPGGWPRASLVATAPGLGLALSPAALEGASDITLKLVEDLPIRGRILDLQGKPVVGASVRVSELSQPEDGDLNAAFKQIQKEGWDRSGIALFGFFPERIGRNGQLLPSLATTKTDATGAFEIAGVGAGRLASVLVEGPSIATAQLQVVTQKGDTLVIPVYPKRKGNSETVSIYRQGFQYVALPTQPFHGVVTDKETGVPLAGMVVLPAGRHWMGKAITDKDGRYRLLGLPSGFHTIRVEAGRDQPYHHHVDGGGQKTGIEPVRLDFALTKAPWVTGRVIDARTKEPIVGAKLEYNPNRDNKSAWDYLGLDFDVNSRAETDAAGRFRIRALPGNGWLFVGHERPYIRASSRELQGDIENRVTPDKIDISGKEYLSEWTNAIVAVTAEKEKGNDYAITLDAGTTVSLTVTDSAGKPVAEVVARGLAYPWYNWSRPLAAGKINVEAIDLARPRAVVFYHADRELGALFQPAAGDAGPWAVRLQPTATVTGRVLLDGKPIANAQISSSFSQPGQMGWSEPPKREAAIKTDAVGRFRIPNVIADLDYVIGYSITQGTTYRSGSHPLRLKPGEKKDLGDIEVPKVRK